MAWGAPCGRVAKAWDRSTSSPIVGPTAATGAVKTVPGEDLGGSSHPPGQAQDSPEKIKVNLL
jgi:hypothetical protein